MQRQPFQTFIKSRWQHAKDNGTAYFVAVLTAAFIWAQWPTHTGSKLPDQWVTHVGMGYQALFEAAPDQHETAANGQVAKVYMLSRKGLDFMLQDIQPGTQQVDDWVANAKRVDAEQFSGKLAMEWRFQKQGQWIEEYAITNDNHFVHQIRILITPTRILKWSVAFKEKDDVELEARVLGFLDAVTLDD